MKAKCFFTLLILILFSGACSSRNSEQRQLPYVDPAGFVGIKGTNPVSPDGGHLLSGKGINCNYHTYHEFAFGIYTNNAGFPDPAQANDALIGLFMEKQRK